MLDELKHWSLLFSRRPKHLPAEVIYLGLRRRRLRSLRGADCDTDHCLVVAKVRERLAHIGTYWMSRNVGAKLPLLGA